MILDDWTKDKKEPGRNWGSSCSNIMWVIHFHFMSRCLHPNLLFCWSSFEILLSSLMGYGFIVVEFFIVLSGFPKVLCMFTVFIVGALFFFFDLFKSVRSRYPIAMERPLIWSTWPFCGQLEEAPAFSVINPRHHFAKYV